MKTSCRIHVRKLMSEEERPMSTCSVSHAQSSIAARPKMKCIRVLLVDDHFLVRQGLRKYLSHHLDIELVGEATDGEEAVKLTDLLKPDVVVMDFHMPRMNGIDATSSIMRKHPHVQVIGLSFYLGNGNREAFLNAGACRLLEKGTAYQYLPHAIYQAVGKSIDTPIDF